MDSEALSSRVWQLIISVDDIDLSNYGNMIVKPTRRVAAVAKGLQTFAGGFTLDEDVDVDLWRYRFFSEWPYVASLCSFTEEDLSPSRGWYISTRMPFVWDVPSSRRSSVILIKLSRRIAITRFGGNDERCPYWDGSLRSIFSAVIT